MSPTILDGDHILVNELVFKFWSPRRGDVIVFKYPENEDQYFIKRVIGLPGETVLIRQKSIYINEILDKVLKKNNISIIPDLIKGVRGTSNKEHVPEHLLKGILRAKHNIFVNKDGTTRYDMIELPITHFKPVEIGTSIEKLIEIGYIKDIKGRKLENKTYYRHSGYIGGLKSITAKKLMEKRPEDLIRFAVKGMLPKNRLGRKLFKKLKVYSGDQHPHAAQQPEALAL